MMTTPLMRKPASSTSNGELTNDDQTVYGKKTFNESPDIDGTSLKSLRRPALYAVRSSSFQTMTVGVEGTVIWNSKNIENGGDNYNTSTGVFTAPVAGKYRVAASINMGTAGGSSVTGWSFIAYKNYPGTPVEICRNSQEAGIFTVGAALNGPTISASCLVDLSIGDTVTWRFNHAGSGTVRVNTIGSSLEIVLTDIP